MNARTQPILALASLWDKGLTPNALKGYEEIISSWTDTDIHNACEAVKKSRPQFFPRPIEFETYGPYRKRELGCWDFTGYYSGNFEEAPRHRLLMIASLMIAFGKSGDAKGLSDPVMRGQFVNYVIRERGIDLALMKRCAEYGFEEIYGWTPETWMDALKGVFKVKGEFVNEEKKRA